MQFLHSLERGKKCFISTNKLHHQKVTNVIQDKDISNGNNLFFSNTQNFRFTVFVQCAMIRNSTNRAKKWKGKIKIDIKRAWHCHGNQFMDYSHKKKSSERNPQKSPNEMSNERNSWKNRLKFSLKYLKILVCARIQGNFPL